MGENKHTPSKPGWYWAKWKIADDGTRDGGELTPSDRWEVVEVVDNGGEDPADKLRVSVSGVEKTQSVENFFWGDRIIKADIMTELVAALQASTHALRSYQYGNAATELAESIAGKNDAVLSKIGGA